MDMFVMKLKHHTQVDAERSVSSPSLRILGETGGLNGEKASWQMCAPTCQAFPSVCQPKRWLNDQLHTAPIRAVASGVNSINFLNLLHEDLLRETINNPNRPAQQIIPPGTLQPNPRVSTVRPGTRSVS